MSDDFSLTVFLNYLFAMVFFFITCAMILLYNHSLIAFILTRALRLFVLGKDVYLRIGGLSIAPLRCRIFLKDVEYTTANMSVKFVDGYVTFAYWGNLLFSDEWRAVDEKLLKCADEMRGMACQVKVGTGWQHGTIHAVQAKAKTVSVWLGGPTHYSARYGGRSPSSDGKSNNDHEGAAARSEEQRRSDNTLDDNEFEFSPPRDLAIAAASSTSPPRHGASDDDDDISVVCAPIAQVLIRQKASRIRCHFNGLAATLHNNTAAYEALSSAAGDKPADTKEVKVQVPTQQPQSNTSAAPGGFASQKKVRAKSSFELFMEFVDSIAFTMHASVIDIGGPAMPHPHCLHMGFEQADGRYSITREGVANWIDLYRHVVDVAFTNVDVKWLHTHEEPSDKEAAPAAVTPNSPAAVRRAASPKRDRVRAADSVYMSPLTFSRLRERAQLLFSGKSVAESGADAPADEPVDPLQYTTILDRKSKATMQMIYYWDEAGLQPSKDDASLHVTCAEQLPKMGIDITIGVPEMCYGPWCDFSRKKLTQFFYPLTYKPLARFVPSPGEPRPIASFETFVEFAMDTVITMPFKIRAPTPSPPHGVRDSGKFGSVTIEIGAGSQMVFKLPYYIFPSPAATRDGGKGKPHHGMMSPAPTGDSNATTAHGDDNSSCDFMFTENTLHLKKCVISTSLNKSKFLQADVMDVMIDGKYPVHWHELQHYDYIVRFDRCEMWYYAEHYPFFMDLIFDFGYVPQMYHGEPLPKTKQERTDVYVNSFVPYVMMYEVFFDGGVAIHLGANTDNVLYAADATSVEENTLVTLAADKGHSRYYYNNNSYYTAAENDVKCPYDFSLTNAQVKVSFPEGHPGHRSCSSGAPCLAMGVMEVDGHYTMMCGDLRQEVTPLDPSTSNAKSVGRARFTDVCLLQVDISSIKGSLTGYHVKALTNAWNNHFGSSYCCVAPQDLNWVPTSGANGSWFSNNTKGAFLRFTKRNEPRPNDLEMLTTLRVTDVDIAFCTSHPPP